MVQTQLTSGVDVWPHPLTAEGRAVARGRPGDTLAEIVPPEMFDHAVASVDGAFVAKADWDKIVLREGINVQVRAVVKGDDDGGSNPTAIVLTIAVLVAAFYAGPAAANLLGLSEGTKAFALASNLATATVATVGALAVNALFPARAPRGLEESEQFSLSASRNRLRPLQPLMLVLGEYRVHPDFANVPYHEFRSYGTRAASQQSWWEDTGDYTPGETAEPQDNAQFLNLVFDFGIGDLEITAPRIGSAELSTFDQVSVQTNNATLRAAITGATDLVSDQVTLFDAAVDTIAGRSLDTTDQWQEFASPGTTVGFTFDIISLHYRTEDGVAEARAVRYEMQWRNDGETNWSSTFTASIIGRRGERTPRRVSVHIGRHGTGSRKVSIDGRIDVRIRRTTTDQGYGTDLPRHVMETHVLSVRFPTGVAATYGERNVAAMRILATGQLHGTLDVFSALVRHRFPVPSGGVWGAATATNNPAAIYRGLLRGIYDGTDLIGGVGLADAQIDHAALSDWYDFCETNSLECNLPIVQETDDGGLLALVAQCGWASPTMSTGKWGVVWERSDSPVVAVFSPANIVAGSLSVLYDNEGLADKILGEYVDAESGYELNSLERDVTGVAITKHPVTVPLRGITNGEQAAKEINRTAAAQHYHQRIISFTAPQEGFLCVRGDVVVLSHGLVGGAVGGRLTRIDAGRTSVDVSNLPADSALGQGESRYMWVWTPRGTVHSTTYTFNAGDDRPNRITLADALPAHGDDPTAYKYTAYDGQMGDHRVQITGVRPGADGFEFTARDEIAAYYSARTSDLTHPLIATTKREVSIVSLVVSDHLRDTAAGDEIVVTVRAETAGDFRRAVVTVALLTGGEPGPVETVAEMDRDGIAVFASPATTGTLRVTVTPGSDLFPTGRGVSADHLIESVPEVDSVGRDGNRWYSGVGAPGAALGNDDDYYFETDTGVVYLKTDGAWGVLADLTGPAGDGTEIDLTRFLRPLVEVPVQAEGLSISAATTFVPDPAVARLTYLASDGAVVHVGVSGDISTDGVSPTLVGSNADLFELVSEED